MRHDRAPRFDDLSLYEIRCFVRRHDPRCPRQHGRRDCHGQVTWSEPVGPYRLAGPLDPRGTAHRPTTIALPDRASLVEAAKLGAGVGGVRVASPPDMRVDAPNGTGSFQICSFSIPLITIVATFLLRIILPVVVFLFGLWILLALKICIPPSLSLDADLDLALKAQPPDVDADATFETTWSAKIDTLFTGPNVKFTDNTTSGGVKPDNFSDFGNRLKAQAPFKDKVRVANALGAVDRLGAPGDDLIYEKHVARQEVLTR
jgi:hypothetical protein